jgi:Protein of unknown function (DUF3551)
MNRIDPAILASLLEGTLMRAMAGAILVIGTMVAVSPALAQTYDPSYPICLQTYALGGGKIECGYTSMAQCRLSASGRAAQCLTNPYSVDARQKSLGRVHRRQQQPLNW